MVSFDKDNGNDRQPIDYGYMEDELNLTSVNSSIQQQMVSLHCSSMLLMRIWPPISAQGPTPALVPSVPAFAPVTNLAPSFSTQAKNSQESLIQLALTNPHLAQLLIQQQQQHQQQQSISQQMSQSLPFALPAAPIVQPVPPPNPVPNHMSVPPSPSKAFWLPHPVSCYEFCDWYKVNVADKVKLNMLEFIPGKCEIKALGWEDWQEVAKFSKLGWGQFLMKHKQFIEDVASGGWELSGVESVGN